MSKIKKSTLINKYVEALRENNASLFLGAGASLFYDFPNWTNLLKGLAEEIDLEIDKEKYNLPQLAQFIQNEKGRNELINHIYSTFNKRYGAFSELHQIIAHLPIKNIWTTNYDRSIERAIQKYSNNDTSSIASDVHLTRNTSKKTINIYKMHGDIEFPESLVISKDDYDSYMRTHKDILTVLAGQMLEKTFLFIGYGFGDPDFNSLLADIRYCTDPRTNSPKTHYAIFLKQTDEYDIIKQNYFINDLHRYGINVCLVDGYKEIDNILNEIKIRYTMNQIFISGSIKRPTENWDNNKIRTFIGELTKELLINEFKITTGFGEEVGSYVISAAIEYLQKTDTDWDDKLKMKPFPQQSYNEEIDLNYAWSEYRNDIMQRVGVAIFIFGNKEVNGKIIDSDGMLEEYEIAKKNNVKIIPVASTGAMALKIYEKFVDVNEAKNLYKDNEKCLNIIDEIAKETDNKKIIEKIISILKCLNGGEK